MTDERDADQAQYLVSWLSILKSDARAGAAASKASEAASFSQSRNDSYLRIPAEKPELM
jgi:antirestriction protein ArdC